MSEDLLFGKISEPEMTVVNFDDHFRDRKEDLERKVTLCLHNSFCRNREFMLTSYLVVNKG